MDLTQPTQELCAQFRRYITGHLSLDALYAWIAARDAAVRGDPVGDFAELVDLFWTLHAELQQGVRDEVSIRQELAAELTSLPPAATASPTPPSSLAPTSTSA